MKRYHLGLRLLCGVLLAVVFSMLIRWSGAAETMPPELSASKCCFDRRDDRTGVV